LVGERCCGRWVSGAAEGAARHLAQLGEMDNEAAEREVDGVVA
jgi:hypothetical protein